ncbi:MAG: DUF86 domain-containing protein [Thermodesulfovibrionales bacterium]|nr:DUF86 domain-containing protein [Thermodesulfovibrionales bacterium]
MQYRTWLFRVNDILDAITAVQQYVVGMTYDNFAADRKTVDAVIRNLIIIGEAAGHIPDEICQAQPEIPWNDMRAMRNFVVHEYFGVSDRILWDTVQMNLPPLIQLLRVLVEQYSEEGPQ